MCEPEYSSHPRPATGLRLICSSSCASRPTPVQSNRLASALLAVPVVSIAWSLFILSDCVFLLGRDAQRAVFRADVWIPLTVLLVLAVLASQARRRWLGSPRLLLAHRFLDHRANLGLRVSRACIDADVCAGAACAAGTGTWPSV